MKFLDIGSAETGLIRYLGVLFRVTTSIILLETSDHILVLRRPYRCVMPAHPALLGGNHLFHRLTVRDIPAELAIVDSQSYFVERFLLHSLFCTLLTPLVLDFPFLRIKLCALFLEIRQNSGKCTKNPHPVQKTCIEIQFETLAFEGGELFLKAIYPRVDIVELLARTMILLHPVQLPLIGCAVRFLTIYFLSEGGHSLLRVLNLPVYTFSLCGCLIVLLSFLTKNAEGL